MGKAFKTILITTLILAIVVQVSWQISRARTFQFFGGIVPNIETDKKIVALTFDDGPTQNTQSVLQILEELGVKATFFITGAELEKFPEEGRSIVLAGHELGNHSYSHQRMVLKAPSFIKKEIEMTDSLIRR